MLPHYNDVGLDNGVGQVIYHYHKFFPRVGVNITTNVNNDYDLSFGHLGHLQNSDVFASHGFWFGNDVNDNKRRQNALLTQCALNAKAVIVPSEYVAETFRREFRINPHVVGHGVNYNEWQHNKKNEGYILWNKNRNSAVCNPQAVYELAKRFPKLQFITTYCNESLDNITVTGRLPFEQMKPLIQRANIHLATARETFNISCLESLASGVPVLGFNWGGTADIVKHKHNGYLVNPHDYNALADGLGWLLGNRKQLIDNCKETAQQYSWLSVVEKLKGVFIDVLS